MIWLLGLAGGLFLFFSNKNGESAFPPLPTGVLPTPISVDDVQATSGRKYRVGCYRTTLGIPGGVPLLYYAAARKGSKDWITYYFDPTTKVRTIGGVSFETPAGRVQLQEDYSL